MARPAAWVEGLEDRLLMAAPVIDPIAIADSGTDIVHVPATKTLFVPLSGSDADGDPITYTATSSDPNVEVTVRQGTPTDHPYLRLNVTYGPGGSQSGVLEFQLFDDLAPGTVARISELVNQNFYDNLTFHRIVKNFMIQGGDPNGLGTGGTGQKFDDEFVPEAIFSGFGQLAMANGGKDTNDSQFFVTTSSPRGLDFNHTIFGQLVRGFDVLAALNNQSVHTNPVTGENSFPDDEVTITDASIVTDTTDTVLVIQAPVGTGLATIQVTATDPNSESSTRDFTAQYTTDTTNDPPILGPVGDQSAFSGVPHDITLTSADLENGAVEYAASITDTPSAATVTINGNVVTVRPADGFTGTFHLRVGVKQAGATMRGPYADPFDWQTIAVNVAQVTIDATGQPVTAAAGVEATVTLAHFTADAGSESDFTATVSFDGGPDIDADVVANPQGGFDVVATHTFDNVGTVPFVVTIDGPGGATANASENADVQPPTITPNPLQASGFAGLQTSAAVANFTTNAPGALASNFTASLDFGGGVVLPGTVVANNQGGFDVVLNRTFDAAGTYPVTITIDGPNSSTATTSTDVDIAVVSINATGQNAAATVGVEATVTLAHFTVDAANAAASDFTATVSFNNGAPVDASVVANPQGGFDVVLTRTFNAVGTIPAAVTINGPAGATDSAQSQVGVSAVTLTPFPVNSSAVAGVSRTITAAHFTASAGALGDFAADVVFDDGTTAAGTIVANPQGGFDVMATHTFLTTGDRNINVVIHGPGSSSATVSSTVSVSPFVITPQGFNLSATVGVSTTATVAHFTASGGSASDFTATVQYDNGTPENATVVANSQGGFDVVATHTYTRANSNTPVKVTIKGPVGSNVTANSTANVQAAAQAALALTINDSPDPVKVGDNLTYTLTVNNSGNASATGLSLTLNLPSNVTFVSSSVSPTSNTGNVLTIPLADLAAGSSRSIQVVVKPTAAGQLNVSAKVDSTATGNPSATQSAATTVNPADTAPGTPGTPNPPTTPGGGSPNPETGPQLMDLTRIGLLRDPTVIVLTFNADLDLSRASDRNNYMLVSPGRDGRLGTRDDFVMPIDAAAYDATTRTVTLYPHHRLKWFAFAHLHIVSGGQFGLTDTEGRGLDGNLDGLPGGDSIIRFGRGMFFNRAEGRLRSLAVDAGKPNVPRGPVGHLMSLGTTVSGRDMTALLSDPEGDLFRQAFRSLPETSLQRVASNSTVAAAAVPPTGLLTGPDTLFDPITGARKKKS